ncbi:MAG: fatty acid--CoA ligase family protein, partial [Cytophagales bacterium]|nr:fatty acid--CoA ligase family protein [Cytophagales bacterium]
RNGASVSVGHSMSLPGALLKKIKDHGTTIFPGVPSLFMLLVQHYQEWLVQYGASLRTIEISSASVTKKLVESLQDILPQVRILNTYGLTEALRATYFDVGTTPNNEVPIGLPNPGVNIRIQSDSGEECATNEIGELYISGPNVALGYWHRDQLNKTAFSPVGYKTGDLACRDDNGLIFIKGRIDEMIKVGAEKVYPVEIENLVASIDGVADAVSFGVSDPILGQKLNLVVKRTGKNIDSSTIQQLCRKKLEKHKVIDSVYFVEQFPLAQSGKVDKNKFIELFKNPN